MGRIAALLFLSFISIAVAKADEAPPSSDLRWIQLSDHVVPPGGVVDRNGDQWVVHGVLDGAAYRFESGHHFLYVSGVKGLAWTDLYTSKSWLVVCDVWLPSNDRQCSIRRMVLADPSMHKIAGLEIRQDSVCLVTEIMTQYLEIRIDSAPPFRMKGPYDYCMPKQQGAQFERDLLAGRSVVIKGYFARTEPVVDLTLPTDGLKQAIQLRDWISDQYEAGKLQASPPND